jgi:hypothetical protein
MSRDELLAPVAATSATSSTTAPKPTGQRCMVSYGMTFRKQMGCRLSVVGERRSELQPESLAMLTL